MIHLKYTDKSITMILIFPVLTAMDFSQEDMLLSLLSEGCSKGYLRLLKSTPRRGTGSVVHFCPAPLSELRAWSSPWCCWWWPGSGACGVAALPTTAPHINIGASGWQSLVGLKFLELCVARVCISLCPSVNFLIMLIDFSKLDRVTQCNQILTHLGMGGKKKN